MTQLVPHDPAIEELIAKLDPERDYGTRTFEQVVQEIREGLIKIQPNNTGENARPFLSLMTDNSRIKGSGMPVNSRGYSRETQLNHQRFLERGREDFDKVYKALIRSATGEIPDPRAIKLFLQYFIGDPEKFQSGVSTDTIKALTDLANATRNRVQIDATGRPIEVIDVSP